MFLCRFKQSGRVALGCVLRVETLDAAICTGRKILADGLEADDFDGLEIWLDSALLYVFDGQVAVSPRMRAPLAA